MSVPKICYIDEHSASEIVIDQDGTYIIDTTSGNYLPTRTIRMTQPGKLYIFGLFSGAGNYQIEVVNQSPEAHTYIRQIVLSRDEEVRKHHIRSLLQTSHGHTDVAITAIAAEGGNIQLDGIVDIASGISKSAGHIREYSIFLGNKGQIRGIPSLMVGSADVEASHAARVERIPDEKLYYLRSRGIPKDDAVIMLVSSAIEEIFGDLNVISPEEKERLCKVAFSSIFDTARA